MLSLVIKVPVDLIEALPEPVGTPLLFSEPGWYFSPPQFTSLEIVHFMALRALYKPCTAL